MILRSILPLMLLAAPAAAEIRDASDAGFTSEHKVTIAAPPAKVWDALLRPGLWWEGGHTYSGDAANLAIDARPGGCWCEKTATGGVEHMRIVYVARGEMLRMTIMRGRQREMLEIELRRREALAAPSRTWCYRGCTVMLLTTV